MSDCNYLKTVNDQYGHEYGDILLRVEANTLKEIFPEDCPVIRMGGDEFLILANETSEEKAAIAYNKAVDLAKAAGIHKNFEENYITELSAREYAEIYTNLKISPKYINYLSTLSAISD